MKPNKDHAAGETLEERPGWSGGIDLAKHMTGPARFDAEKRRTLTCRTAGGRLVLEAENAPAEIRGVLAAAAAVATETCEVCGGKGNPIADADGRRTGSRCRKCQGPGTTVIERQWDTDGPDDHPYAVSPGQWTADIRGGSTGNEWEHTNWRHYRQLETAYGERIAELMAADNDESATRLWAGGPGWAGLLRALFVTLQPEQDERPEDPRHIPWRLRWMKEKFGGLDVRTTKETPYQQGARLFIETLSYWICIKCRQPAQIRSANWIRPECDMCWAKATPADRADDEERRPKHTNAEPPEKRLRDMMLRW